VSKETVFDWATLQAVLTAWPAYDLGEVAGRPTEDAILGRIRQILIEAQEFGSVRGISDLVALVRHALISRSSRAALAQLRVPKGQGWPDAEAWHRSNIQTISTGDNLILEAEHWHPGWLDVTSGEDFFADVFVGTKVRQASEIPIDPFLEEACGYPQYICPGQAEAVRSLLFMPVGWTLIVNLPTGAGKTLVGQTPTLINGLNRGLTLFIVPTTALAQDLARRMRPLLERTAPASTIPELAWYSGLGAETKANIKRRIRNGSQGILFASPEAATGALLPALYDAAVQGTLKYLVVDEAHIIAQWGDSFRPAFQTLAGIRRGLLRRCAGDPFRTVLVSATFSPQTVATLDCLFGPRDTVQMVSAIYLRPEPRYWSLSVTNSGEKISRVLEFVRHAPRPFVLHVTKRDDARTWLQRLRQEGFTRTECFHGETPYYQRETIINRWADDQLDGIVATSAFGVGIDKDDVRTIIHAAVPETLDRYYQEVGRGGRDGRTSISIVVYTQDDVGIAEGLSRPSIIGDDNAFERWDTTFAARRAEFGISMVDITLPPPRLHQQSDYNNAWNMRTLILMACAGLIELDSFPPTSLNRQLGEEEEAYEARLDALWEQFYNLIPIRVRDPLHRDQAHFESCVSNERQRGSEAADQSFDDLMAAFEGRKEMANALSDIYRSNVPGRIVIISKICRGYPAEPIGTRISEGYQIPFGAGIERLAQPETTAWTKRFPWLAGGTNVILYPRVISDLDERLGRALTALVTIYGIREVSALVAKWQSEEVLRKLHRATPGHVLIARRLEDDVQLTIGLPLPRATVLWPWRDDPIPDYLVLLNRPLHVIFAPEDVRSKHPLRRFVDTATNHIGLDSFLAAARNERTQYCQ
jgi:ATP-dependent DNA helicase RecQ